MTIHERMPEGFNPKMQVSACYIEYQDKILLLLRQDHKPYGNTWCLPGGKIDKDETPLETVIREIREETTINLKQDKATFFRTFYVIYPEMDFIYHLFHSNFQSKPEVKISLNEHKDYCWSAPLDSLKLPLIPKGSECIKRYYKI